MPVLVTSLAESLKGDGTEGGTGHNKHSTDIFVAKRVSRQGTSRPVVLNSAKALLLALGP